MANICTVQVDTRDFKAVLSNMENACKPDRYQRVLHRIYRRTGGHVKQILKKDLPQEYEISASKVGKAVQNYQIIGNGCIIPIRDKRGDIGGQYKAYGSARGWESVRKKYRVKAKILKRQQSLLPMKMEWGYPPFRNIPSKLGKLTFTRTRLERGPIMKVTGIAIPQMPMNRSQDDVQRDIREYIRQQIDHEFLNLFAGRY